MSSRRPARGPRVAVVGRPNVGKSTLVNRLAGRREAIAHEMAGVTRDRVELPVSWNGRDFTAVDTGGIPLGARGIDASVVEQARRAIDDADVIVMVVDATTGITEEDEALGRRLRGSKVPVVVAANKVDGERQEPLAAEFHGLGLGDPVSVSALHGRSSADLLDRILALLPDQDETAEPEGSEEPRFALVGRPNVGKSSLFNRLVGQERVVVHDQPGTTRDAIDSLVEIDGRTLRFVDTAGFRRPLRTEGVEYYSLVRALRAIDASHVALLVVDAPAGLTGEDKRVAARVAEAGRGMVAALNKWDLLPSGERARLFVELKHQLELFPGTPVLRTSALTGMGVGRLAPALLTVHDAWNRRVSTSRVNQVLQEAVAAHPPPRSIGRIHYATQTRAAPPTFVLFGTGDPGPAYRRYVANVLRREFGFGGVPLRLSFRRGKGTGGRRGRRG